MATITTELVSTRYNLRDDRKTRYSDTKLIAYYNRALRALDSFLGSVGSDWVSSYDTGSLASGGNSISLPDDFSTPKKAKIGDNKDSLVKETADQVLEWQQDTSSGTPGYYAIHKTDMIFEREAGEDFTIHIYYNLKSTEIVAGAAMPFNDEFNDALRSAVVMIAKNPNELDITGDYALYSFFQSAANSKIRRRGYKYGRAKLGY